MRQIKSTLRETLKNYLDINHLSVYQFAKDSNIPQSTIRNIVQKENYEVRETTIIEVCKGMGIHPSEVFPKEDVVLLHKVEVPLILEYRKLKHDDQCRVQGYIDALKVQEK